MAITAELIIGAPGLGKEIQLAQSGGAIAGMYALIVATGLFGVAINLCMRIIEKRVLSWHASVRGENAGMKLLKSISFILALPVLLILWWVAATLGGASFFVPTPADLAKSFIETWVGERMFTDVLPSVQRLVLGVLGAIVLGVLLGLLVGMNRTARAITNRCSSSSVLCRRRC